MEYPIMKKMQQIFDEKTFMQRWLDVEASLAKAEASLGIIPQEASTEIVSKAKLELLDMRKYDEAFQKTNHPIVALIQTFQSICQGGAGEYIHWGATSQDIVDTANALRLKEAHSVIYQSLRQIEDALLNMAEQYADTVMAGRTHCVHAVPITFGYKVAIWAREIRRHIQRLKECRSRLLVGNITGAVGTMASFGEKGPQVQALTLEGLGLGVPDICWHASRDRSAEFANLLAIIAGTLARIANNVKLLMITEISEVSEWQVGFVGSSTMPQKRNPAVAEAILALTKKVRCIAPLVTESMLVEYERDMNFWRAEIDPLAESCMVMGEILDNSQFLAKNLTVYPDRMTENLCVLKGLIMAERVMLELGCRLGKQSAHEIIYEDAMEATEKGVDFKQVLVKDTRVGQHLTEADIDHILKPEGYVGLAPQMARDMVTLSRKEREKD